MPSSPASEIITYADIEAAAKILDGIAVKTPVLTSAAIDRLAKVSAHFKSEHLLGWQQGGWGVRVDEAQRIRDSRGAAYRGGRSNADLESAYEHASNSPPP